MRPTRVAHLSKDSKIKPNGTNLAIEAKGVGSLLTDKFYPFHRLADAVKILTRKLMPATNRYKRAIFELWQLGETYTACARQFWR